MVFKIDWTKGALDELDRLEPQISRRIIKKVDELSEDPYLRDIKRLKGVDAFRLRIGDYRAIFEIENGVILILKIGHRRNIYD